MDNKHPEGDAALPPWTAIAVFGSWHPNVPTGKCMIYATRGGSLAADARRRRYLAPTVYLAKVVPFEINPLELEEVPW